MIRAVYAALCWPCLVHGQNKDYVPAQTTRDMQEAYNMVNAKWTRLISESSTTRQDRTARANVLKTSLNTMGNMFASVVPPSGSASGDAGSVFKQLMTQRAGTLDAMESLSTATAEALKAVTDGEQDKTEKFREGDSELAQDVKSESDRLKDERDEAEEKITVAQSDAEKQVDDKFEDTKAVDQSKFSAIEQETRSQRSMNTEDTALFGQEVKELNKDLKVEHSETETELKAIQAWYTKIEKEKDKQIDSAHIEVENKIVNNAEKAYEKVEKDLEKTVAGSETTLAKDRLKFVDTTEKQYNAAAAADAKVTAYQEKTLEKALATEEKEVDRWVGSLEAMDSAMRARYQATKENLGDLTSLNSDSVKALQRLGKDVPNLANTIQKGLDGARRDVRDEGRALAKDAYDGAKSALEQAALAFTEKATGAMDKAREGFGSGYAQMQKAMHAAYAKLEEAAAASAQMERQLQDEQRETAGTVRTGAELALSAASEQQSSLDRVMKTQISARNAFTGHVLDFIQRVDRDLKKLDQKVQATTGGGQLQQVVGIAMEKLSSELLSGLDQVVARAAAEARSAASRAQEKQLDLALRLAHLKTATGAVDQEASDDEEQSAYSYLTREAPAQLEGVLTKADHAKAGMYTKLLQMDKSLQLWEENTRRAVDIALTQQRTVLTSHVSEAGQAMEEQANAEGYQFSDNVEAVLRSLQGRDEEYAFNWKTLQAELDALFTLLTATTNRHAELKKRLAEDQKMADHSELSGGTLQTMNMQVESWLDKGAATVKRIVEKAVQDAKDKTVQRVGKTLAGLTAKGAGVENGIAELQAKAILASQESVRQAAGDAAALKGVLSILLTDIGTAELHLDEGHKGLRGKSGRLVAAALEAGADERQLAGAAREDAQMHLEKERVKLDEALHDGIQMSREGETELMTGFQNDALHLSQKAKAFETAFDARVNAERRAVSDKAASGEAGREQAQALAEDAAGAWRAGIADQDEKLSVISQEAHAKQEKENGAATVLAREEDTNGQRLSEGAHVLTDSVDEGGDKTARNIATVEEKVATDAEMARVASTTELQGVASAERVAAGKLDAQSQALAAAVGGEMGNISDIDESGMKQYNLTERQVQELEAFVSSERGSQGDNRMYLQKYARQAAASALVLLTRLVGQEMAMTHGAFEKNALLEQRLHRAEGVLGDLTSSEAFRALHSIAAADELATKTGQGHEDMLTWLELFTEGQGEFRARVNAALKDQGVMEEFERLQAEEAMREQREQRERMAWELQQRMARKLQEVIASDDSSTDTAALDSAMGASVRTLQELGQTRAAADREQMQRLRGELSDTDSKAARQLRERADVLARLSDEKQGAKQQLSTVDSLILSLQKANDKKMDEETELLNKRAKSFSQELLLGESISSPDLEELRQKAASLSKQNAQLEKRHATTEKSLRTALAHISKASAAVIPGAYQH